jgi:hypothetical protein
MPPKTPILIDNKKPCSKCGLYKSLCDFYPDKRLPYSRRSACIGCSLEDISRRQQKYKSREIDDSTTDYICCFCNQIKSSCSFHKDRNNPRGRSYYCRECFNLYQRRRSTLRYGLTYEEFESLLKKQSGKCAICKCEEDPDPRAIRFSIDHNHITGEVRGLLCSNCNRAVGLLQDNPDIIDAAAIYIRSSESK